MANRDLLKEAIADAKALKETAIANAKAALEEAFEPRLKSMLSAKLEEMEKEELEEAEEEMTEAKKEKDEMDEGYDKEKVDEEMDLDEILAELEEGEDKEDMKEAKEEIDEAKEDLDEAKEEIDEVEEVTEAEEDEDVEVDAEEEDSEEDEDEEIDLEDMSEEDLKKFIEDVIEDMVKAGELEAGEDFEDDVDVEVDADGEIEVEDDEMTSVDLAEGEDIDEGEKEDMDEGKEELNEVGPEVALAAALGIPAAALATMGLQAAIDKAAAKGNKVAMALSKGMEKMGSVGKAGLSGDDGIKEELDELRAELHEVNLLNAKLLYTNKIFRAKNLKEAQKVKVLEAFDKASNVSEVKLIFETLNEGMVTKTPTTIKENLGSASKPTGVANKAPIMEVDPQVVRWQKLAGIK